MHSQQLSCQEDGAVHPICQAVAPPAQVNTLTFRTTSNPVLRRPQTLERTSPVLLPSLFQSLLWFFRLERTLGQY